MELTDSELTSLYISLRYTKQRCPDDVGDVAEWMPKADALLERLGEEFGHRGVDLPPL